MHELSVTEQVLRLALTHLERSGAQRISAIHLAVGSLSSMVDDSVQFYWGIISAGTPAEGARLRFRRIPMTFSCDHCRHTFSPSEWPLACPLCSADTLELVAGEEFHIEALDVERLPAEVKT